MASAHEREGLYSSDMRYPPLNDTALFSPSATPGEQDSERHDAESILEQRIIIPPSVEDGIKRLEGMFDKCQTLLCQMKNLTIHVAGSFGEAVKTQHQILLQKELTQRSTIFEHSLQEERERSCKRLQNVRKDHKKMTLQMISTVKAYFKRVMQDVGKSQKKQLEEARKEGFREGMQRQRELLQTNLICSHCARQGNELYVCGGCWSACYCGPDCQKVHWRQHEHSCGTAANEDILMTSPEAP